MKAQQHLLEGWLSLGCVGLQGTLGQEAVPLLMAPPPAPALCRRVSQILATALPTGAAIPILQTGKVRPQGTQHRCRSLSATPGCPESSPLLFPPREKQLRAGAGAGRSGQVLRSGGRASPTPVFPQGRWQGFRPLFDLPQSGSAVSRWLWWQGAPGGGAFIPLASLRDV